ncbi:MAG: hypothetical protein KAS78_00050, partial [Candidatus Pacebacteria bacterium]|nr:hypothetical protein [Candidatus Paceibacterota bacterium]
GKKRDGGVKIISTYNHFNNLCFIAGDTKLTPYGANKVIINKYSLFFTTVKKRLYLLFVIVNYYASIL